MDTQENRGNNMAQRTTNKINHISVMGYILPKRIGIVITNQFYVEINYCCLICLDQI